MRTAPFHCCPVLPVELLEPRTLLTSPPVEMPGLDDSLHAIAVQSDGKIVAMGANEVDDFVVRYLPDGSLDDTFGEGGIAKLNSERQQYDEIAIDAVGRIVLGGVHFSSETEWDSAILRLTPTGAADTSFNDGNPVIVPVVDWDDQVTALLVQPDGKILAAGPADNVAVLRFLEDGTLDSSFGSGGIAYTDAFSDTGEARLALQPDGKILITGASHNGYVVQRLNANGSPDASFGDEGIVQIQHGGTEGGAHAIALLGDGRILVGGESLQGATPRFGLARVLSDGAPDDAFDGDGQVITAFEGDGRARIQWLIPQGGGSVLAVGTQTRSDLSTRFAAVRYEADGSIDETFGDSGILIWNPDARFAGARDLAVQQDDRLLLAGWALGSDSTDAAVARFSPNLAPDSTFGGDGYVSTAVPPSNVGVKGTAGDDVIFARIIYLRDIKGPRLQVWVNADPETAPPTHEWPVSEIADLWIDAGAGNDVVTLETSGMFPRTSVIGGDGEDRFAVTGTGTAAMIEFDGGGHNDTLEVDTVYSPLAVVFPIRLTAGDDADALVINGTSGADRYVFRASDAFAAGNHHITTGRLSSLTLNAGAGDDEVTIDPESAFPPVTVAGGDGNDRLDITVATSATVRVPRFQFDGQAGSDGLTARLTPIAMGAIPRHGFNGGEGIDEFRFVGSDLNDSVRLLINSGVPFVEGNGQRIDLVNVEQEIYGTGLGHDTVQVGSHPMSAHVDTGDGNDRLIYIGGTDGEYITFELASVHDDDDRDTLELLRGEFTFIDNLNGTSPYLTVRADTFAHVTFEKSQAFAALEVGDGSTVTLAAGGDKTMTLRSLLLSPKGTLDLVDNELTVLAYDAWQSVLASIEKWVGTARNGSGLGIWRGAGITSSAARNEPRKGLAVWANDMIDAPFVPIMVKYTWNGDATLDGKINADDYFLIDTGFLSRPDKPLYRHGDFNYDDRINADDYFLIDAAFLAQSGTSTPFTATRLASVSSRPSAAKEEERRIRRAVGEPVFNPVRRIRRPGVRR